MPGIATQILSNGTLLDDYIYTQTPPLPQSVTGRFAVVTSGTGTSAVDEIVTVDNNNNLLHLWPDASSQSGWNNEAVTVPLAVAPGQQLQSPAEILRLTAFYDGTTLNALVFFAIEGSPNGALTWMQRTVDSSGDFSWSNVDFGSNPDLFNALGISLSTGVYTDASGVNYIYSVTADGEGYSFYLVYKPEGTAASEWSVCNAFPAQSQIYTVMPGAGGAEFTVLWVTGQAVSFQRGSLDAQGNFSWAAESPSTFNIDQGTLNGGSVVPLPAVPDYTGPSCFLLRGNPAADGTCGLYYVEGYDQVTPQQTLLNATNPTSSQLAPTGFTQVAVGLDASSNYIVFATDNVNQSLWLLRQSGVDSNGGAAFGDWVMLGNVLGAMDCPRVMAAGPAAYAVSLAGGPTLVHFAQSLTGLATQPYGMWYVRSIEGPLPSTNPPVNTPTYANILSFQDENGSAAAVSLVNITADRATVLIVNGVSYNVDQNTPAQIACSSASLMVTMPAQDLSAPVLTVSVPAANLTAVIKSDASMHNRLAGNDATFPVNSATLTSAGLISSQYQSNADQLTEAITSAAAQLNAMSANTTGEARAQALDALPVKHWSLRLDKETGTVAFQALEFEEAGILSQLPGSAATTLKGIWGDVCHFFKTVADDVANIVVKVVDDTLQLAIELAHWAWQGVVSTVEEAAGFLEMIFAKVAEGVADAASAVVKAVNWLKMLFDWADILNTQQALVSLVTQTLSYLTGALGDNAIAWVDSQFANFENSVNTLFANCRTQIDSLFGSGGSLNSYAGTISGTPGTNVLGSSQYQSVYSQNSEQCNYVSSRAGLSGQGQASFALATAGGSPPASFTNLVTVVADNLGADFTAAYQQFKTLLQKQQSDPKGLLNTAIDDILDALQVMIDFIISVIRDVVTAMLQCTADAMSGFSSALQAPIDIPFLSWLFGKISGGEPLTLLNLIALIAAVPTTIIYKIVKGSAPVEAGTSITIPWPALAWQSGSNTAMENAGATVRDAAGTWSQGVGWVGIGSLLKLFADVGLGVACWGNTAPPDGSPEAKVISYLDAVLNMIVQIAALPVGLSGAPGVSVSTELMWLAGFVPIGMNAYFTWTTGGDTRFNMATGYPLLIFTGVTLEFLNILLTVEQAKQPKGSGYSGWTYLSNIVGPIPYIATIALYWENDPEPLSNKIAEALFLGTIAVADIASMVAMIVTGFSNEEMTELSASAAPA